MNTFSESMARTITLRLRQPQNILGIESKAESHQSNSNSSNMKKQRLACVIGTLVSSPVAYPDERAPKTSAYKVDRMEKFERKEGNLASGIREHVKLGPKITETVKGKLSLGDKIIRAGGVEKISKQNFSNREGEKLLKASQCYLSTTAGPIAGPCIYEEAPNGTCYWNSSELCKSSVQKSPKSLLCNPDSQYHIPPPPNGSLKFKKSTVIDKMNKLGEKADHLVNAFKITLS
ncbi:unnamed protein product [Camellia sinensis]